MHIRISKFQIQSLRIPGREPTLKPRRGGREQLVTNLRSCRFWTSVKLSMASQNHRMTWCSAVYPPTEQTSFQFEDEFLKRTMNLPE